MPLPRCYFDISINGIPTGRVVFELFADVCPKTCENFRSLCTGEKGEGKTTYKPLHYKATPIHRIVKGFIIQGGDFENGDGSGGESIYGGFFKDENLKLKHEAPFLLSMANKGPNTNGSQYFITTRSAPHLDGVHVVFGRVVQGSEFVTEIENQKVNSKNRPYADIRVSNCGELVLLKRGKVVKPKKAKVMDTSDDSEGSTSDEDTIDSDSSSSSEDSEAERRRRRRKRKKRRSKKTSKSRSKHKQRKTKKRKKVSDSDSDTEKDEEADPVITSTITEEDLPPEISSTASRKSWLYRYSKSPSPVEGETKRKPKREEVVTRGTQGEQAVSSSGRILKGRGNMRYRTPPPPRNVPRSMFRDRYHQRSPDRDRYRQRSPDRDRYRQRSPDRDRYRHRSPDRDRYRQRSPERDRYRQRSPDRDRYRQRSPDRDETQKKSEDDLHQIHDQVPDTDKDLFYKKSPNRDRYHERSPRDRYRERSPRDRYYERSSDRYRERSPDRDRHRERSPDRDRHRERSPDRDRHRERSPDRDRHRERSPDRDRHRERSPDRDRYHENSYQKTQNGRHEESPKETSQLSTAPLVVQRTDQPSQNTMDVEESSTPPLSPLNERMMPLNDEIEEDRTPPLYGDQTEYWSMEANRLVHEAYTTQAAANMGSRWDKPDGGVSGSGQSDEDNELQTACEKVEQTLAEQQFGIGALISEHLK